MATNRQIRSRIGDSVREYRLERNFSQALLAERAGVSLSTVKRLEAGQGCDMDNFINVMRALGRIEDLDEVLPEIQLKPTDMLRLRKMELASKRKRASKRSGRD